LETAQEANCVAWYAANILYWKNGGNGGLTDDEVMVGDQGGVDDGVEGLAFLDRFLLERQSSSIGRQARAMDAGAGLGRVTKHILLKRYDSVHLVEADPGFSKRSRNYLGRKRSSKCTFTCSRLEEFNVVSKDPVDLIWLQWTLQYLTDRDAVHALRTLAGGLVQGTGFLVVKENRPYGGARQDRFQMDTPECSGRYDITRTDAHHRLLFQRAGLVVNQVEEGAETNTYALIVKLK